jgi:4-alpha-glucanotransferase
MTSLKSFLSPDQKIGGILTPISAIRGRNDIGVGDTESLVELAEWARDKGFRVIQILPVNETGFDNSPYNILSSIAYEPCTLATNPEWLPDLSEVDFKKIVGKYDLDSLRSGPVCYRDVKALKHDLLGAAHKNLRGPKGKKNRKRDFEQFIDEESEWLDDYAVFRALCVWNGNCEVVTNWPAEHRSPSAAHEWKESLDSKKQHQFDELVDFFSYVQWVAMTQWRAVRESFDRLGMALVGDIPVGVSVYSADVWATPEIFDLTRSSGAPPEKVFKSDPFTEKWGQNWGFPLYNWQAMSRDNFAWWRRRLRMTCEVFHLLRVDHALGFFRIYNFPWRPEDNARFTNLTADEAMEITGGRLPGFSPFDDSTHENREYNRCQGEMLFQIFLEETEPFRIIAEDLGELSPYVRPTLEHLGIPGFKIPQWERDHAGNIIPGSSYNRLSLATFATHDHPPIRQFWEDWNAQTMDASTRDHAIWCMRELLDFCGFPDIAVPQEFSPQVHEAMLRGLFSCNSWLVVHQITDVFALGDRFNVPGAVGDENWTSRIRGTIGEWDKLYKSQILACSKALLETGRIPSE